MQQANGTSRSAATAAACQGVEWWAGGHWGCICRGCREGRVRAAPAPSAPWPFCRRPCRPCLRRCCSHFIAPRPTYRPGRTKPAMRTNPGASAADSMPPTAEPCPTLPPVAHPGASAVPASAAPSVSQPAGRCALPPSTCSRSPALLPSRHRCPTAALRPPPPQQGPPRLRRPLFDHQHHCWGRQWDSPGRAPAPQAEAPTAQPRCPHPHRRRPHPRPRHCRRHRR